MGVNVIRNKIRYLITFLRRNTSPLGKKCVEFSVKRWGQVKSESVLKDMG
jgi:hypothetical protein